MTLKDWQIERMKYALEKIIEMNRQQGEDQYGDPDQAERWACVKVARFGLSLLGKEANKKPEHS